MSFPKWRSKYGAIRTNGYASKAEAKRGAELDWLEKRGLIKDLGKQIKFVLIEKDELGSAVHYVADFVYYDVGLAKPIVEDVKGFRTPLYRLKRRLMWKLFKIRVQEM